ncbi:FecCD family ABC transporter permease [Tomitella gaofuii]|uniref:FecCD family ABC transporter permease n=1 Tax=Tomitella gaofuii TaxID=2760083 RepID=UPI0015FC4A29|nr:iron ABC transporter permease [Tomitella gaofuii]
MSAPVRGRSRRATAILVIAVAGVVAGCVLSLVVGARPTSPGAAFSALFAGPDGGGGGDLAQVVWQLRVPRTLLALAAGAALAVSGAFAQAWTRNPLADPGIIGITAGAAFAVAVGTTLGVVALGSQALLALAGAGAVALVVLAVSRRTSDPLTLLLVGFGMAAALRAATTLLALQDSSVLDGMRQWIVGSTVGRSGGDLAIAAVGLAVGLVFAAVAARPMDLLAMGESTAVGLGGSPRTTRTLTALAVVILAGSATAAVGPIAFVGFAAPHLVRRFTGPSLSRMLIPTALVGAAITLLADVLGRVVARPGEVEVSVVLAVIGAPLLIASVVRMRRSRPAVFA